MDWQKILRELKKIGFDAIGIGILGGLSYLAGALVPALHGLEVWVGVTAGIWLWPSIRSLVYKVGENA